MRLIYRSDMIGTTRLTMAAFFGGVVVLDKPNALVEGTEVQVEPIQPVAQQSWAEVLKEVIGAADELPADSSRNHDHYLYGTEKK